MSNIIAATNQKHEVKGIVRLTDGSPVVDVLVSAFDRDLRSEQELGQSQTDKQGFYEIRYSSRQFLKAEKGNADLIVKAFATDGSLLAASAVLFKVPGSAEVDITIPAGERHPPSLFEKVEQLCREFERHRGSREFGHALERLETYEATGYNPGRHQNYEGGPAAENLTALAVKATAVVPVAEFSLPATLTNLGTAGREGSSMASGLCI